MQSPITLSPEAGVSFSENPLRFEIMRELPLRFCAQIQNGIRDFMVASEMPIGVDPMGFFQQTIQAIANATALKGGGEFWLMSEGDRVLGYVLASVVRDIDNSLTYWISQAWVSPLMRGDIAIKMAWQRVRDRAKTCFCKHIVVVSSRGTEAYCRWLGSGYHEYARLLKEDL